MSEKPVAWVPFFNGEFFWTLTQSEPPLTLSDWRPLFASPPEPAAQAVTEALLKECQRIAEKVHESEHNICGPLPWEVLANEISALLPQAGKSEAGWRDIASASKDGTKGDLWHPKVGRVVGCEFRNENWWQGGYYADQLVRGATHYMPLPAPPITSGGGDAG